MNQVATRTNVLVIDGQALTTTLDIANLFGKRHADVIRKVESLGLELESNYHQRNFALVEYTDAKGERRPSYQVTRDGFVLLAMGFTGKQALQFKVAYIEEFNRMEAALRGEYVKLSPAQRRELQNAVSARAYELGGSREDFATVYRTLKDHFGVPTYADIPASRFNEALNLIPKAAQPALPPVNEDAMRLLVKQAHELSKKVRSYYGIVDVDTYTLAQDVALRAVFAPAQYRLAA